MDRAWLRAARVDRASRPEAGARLRHPRPRPGLYLSAWQNTLALHERLVREGATAPNPFLERLEQVQQAGYLEEYVWTEYVGFLDASDERRLRLDKFLRWRGARLPELRHEVRAAAQLKAVE
ncbi:MAG: hypothetical protein ACREI8_02730 [Myxococcota bacterium]